MSNQQSSSVLPQYNNKVVKQFAIMTVVWGIVGMLVGVVIAAQLVWPELNFGPWFHFGRLRPLHTNAVIFAFGGCALFASSYYVVQRTSQAALISDRLAAFHFWGWQLVIVAAAITLPLGLTSSKEYAELEWPIDILITLVWVCYGIVFFGTIVKRRVKHIYVANWFFGAFIIAVAVLHIVNSLAVPVSWFKSYSIFPGTIDAMVQWWYGHNAVGFFLTVLPRHDVLLCAQTSGAAGVFLSTFNRPFLGADCYLYLGWPSPPALFDAARLGSESGHGDVDTALGALLGWHDQRHDDALRCLA